MMKASKNKFPTKATTEYGYNLSYSKPIFNLHFFHIKQVRVKRRDGKTMSIILTLSTVQ